jgi:hypothetical protein
MMCLDFLTSVILSKTLSSAWHNLKNIRHFCVLKESAHLMYSSLILVKLFVKIVYRPGVYGDAVGWGTALQVGRSHVRLPMVSLENFLT